MKRQLSIVIIICTISMQAYAYPWNNPREMPPGARQNIESMDLGDLSKPETKMTSHLMYSLQGKVDTVEQIVADKEGNVYILDRKPISVSYEGIQWNRWSWHLQRLHNGKIEELISLNEERPLYLDLKDETEDCILWKYTVLDAAITYDKALDKVYLGTTLRKSAKDMPTSNKGSTIGVILNQDFTYKENTPYFKMYGDGAIRSLTSHNGKVSMYVAPYPFLTSGVEEFLWESNGQEMTLHQLNGHLALNQGDSIRYNDKIAYAYGNQGIYLIQYGKEPYIIGEIWAPIVRNKGILRSLGGIIEKNGEIYYTKLFLPYLYRYNGQKVANTNEYKHTTAIFPSNRGFYAYDALEEVLYEIY